MTRFAALLLSVWLAAGSLPGRAFGMGGGMGGGQGGSGGPTPEATPEAGPPVEMERERGVERDRPAEKARPAAVRQEPAVIRSTSTSAVARKPWYRRWWVWTLLGGVGAGAAAAAHNMSDHPR